MKNRFNEVESIVNGLKVDMDKFFDKGNKAAGTRARKALLELKKLSHELRAYIQDAKNS